MESNPKLEQKTLQKEFPALNKEDMKEIHSLFSELFEQFPEQLPYLEKYTGINETIGGGDAYINSRVTLFQFEYALAITRHPLIKKLINIKYNIKPADIENLIKNKIMVGIKILDLGCGPEPVFARCCRAMGADVWTVDIISASNFIFDQKYFTKEQIKLENEKHIQLNLEDTQAKVIIKSKSSGDFNLVTTANLDSDIVGSKFKKIEKFIIIPLLKKGGIYRNSGSIESPKLKL